MTEESHTGGKGPLDGIRVLDLSLALAGPLCTQRLGDMGAEIIKIEGPNRPDFTRNAEMRGVRLAGETTCYLSLNRNKKSLALDLKTDAGRQVLMTLAKDADVVIQNMRPGVAERLGISFEQLKSVNPRIVYVSISGYGDEGPMVKAPGQDLLVQCFSGMTYNAGTRDGLPHPSPIYLVDVAASHNACEAILAGLIQRDRQGVAVEAKVSLLASVLEIQMQEITTYLTTGRGGLRGEAPYASTFMEPPYGIYRVSDGFVALAQGSLDELADALAAPSIAEAGSQRPDETDEQAMCAWRDRIWNLVQEALAGRNRDVVVQALSARGIWCGPVQTYEEMVAHPQTAELFMTIPHERAGDIRTLAPAIRFSTQPQAPMASAPRLGQHSEQILTAAGYRSEVIEELAEGGAISLGGNG